MVEDTFLLVLRGLLYVREFLADSRPAVRMHPERQRPEQMPHIAIRLFKAALLELFHHYTALHFETLLAESQLQHTVGLQPKGRLYVRLRNCEVVIGNVIIGPGIIFYTRQLQRRIVIGNMRRTTKHQMLEQMGKAGMRGMLVARTDIVNVVQRHHQRAVILVVYQPQAVGETMLIYLHTSETERGSLPKG